MDAVFTNRDLMHELVYKHLALDSSRALLQACGGRYVDQDTAEEMKRMRSSLHRLFRPIADDVDELLRGMIVHNVSLVGRRALHFIYPYLDMSDSSWDFFGDNIGCQVLPVAKVLLTRPGVTILNIQSYTLSTNNPRHPVEVAEYTLKKEGCDKYTVRLMDPGRTNNGVINYIMSLPCTADQCFLTGYAAVSLYDSLTSRGLMIDWITSNEIRYNAYVEDTTRRCTRHMIKAEDIARVSLGGVSPGELLRFLNTLKVEYLTNMSRVPPEDHPERKDEEINRLSAMLGPKIRREVLDFLIQLICTDCICMVGDSTETIRSIEYYRKKGFKITNPRKVLTSEHIPREVKLMFTKLDTTGLEEAIPDIYIANRSIQSGSTSLVIDLTCNVPENLYDRVTRRLERLFAIAWSEVIVIPNEEYIEIPDSDDEKYKRVARYRNIYDKGIRIIEPVLTSSKQDGFTTTLETWLGLAVGHDTAVELMDYIEEYYGAMDTPFGI